MTNIKNNEVVILCAICNRALHMESLDAPKTAHEMLEYCVDHNIPHVIDWDNRGQIITFCCGDHMQMALNPDKTLKNPIPRLK